MSGVPIPTVSQVRDWDLDALARQGSYWTQQAARFKIELDAAYNAVGNSVDYLVGKFGNGTRDKGLIVRDQGYKGVGALEAAGEAIATGIEPVRFAKTTVTSLLATITAGGYQWGEDGSVTLSLSQLANAMSDTDRDAAVIKLAALQRQADQYSTSMKAALAAAGVAAQSVADGINAAMADLPSGGEGSQNPAVDATTGERLGEKVSQPGQIPPEVLTQIDQVFDQTTLTDAEKAALAAGDTVVVPASTLEFTQKFLESAGPDGFARLSEQLSAQGPEGQAKAQALANSVMLLSNENVKGVKADGKQIAGGYEQLPQQYRDMISSRVIEHPGARPDSPGYLPDGNTNTYPDPDGLGQYRAGAQHYENLARFTGALSLADDSYIPGTKLSTELYRQGGFLATMVNDNAHHEWGLPVDGATLQHSVENTVDIAARSKDATTVLFTGEGTPEQVGADYDRVSTVVPLLEYDWSDDSTQRSPVDRMLEWIPADGDARNPSDPVSVANADRADLAARGFIDLVTTTGDNTQDNAFAQLMNIGEDGRSLGQVNPELAQRLEGITARYLNDIGGIPALDGHPEFTGDAKVGKGDATRLFALIATDPTAAEQLVRDVALQQDANAYSYGAQGPGQLGSNLYGEINGNLQRYLESGIQAEALHRGIVLDNQDAIDAYNKALRDNFIKDAGSTLGGLPGGWFPGAVGFAVDAPGLYGGPQVTGLPDMNIELPNAELSVSKTIPGSNLSQLLSIAHAAGIPPEAVQQELASSSRSSGSVPVTRVENGQTVFLPLNEIAANPNIPIADYEQALTKVLTKEGYDVSQFTTIRDTTYGGGTADKKPMIIEDQGQWAGLQTGNDEKGSTR
ncbi:hypothetical protein IU474_16640 [Nocardia otitidiscaviarum]|uniref:TPR repeat region-containing protein n=1 Tax=Nocardia otitidiscaviarum TaxID=1823 RepID=UPI001893E492|nr:hypothetical protein [Nocardia otitidiscaviarum]MBF6238678.1 hypothetical protein [Nocardia otitidiscaviarum]